jgi:molybdopterin-synthase adenylyltransferase
VPVPRQPRLRPSIEVLEAADGDVYLLRADGAGDVAVRRPLPAARALLRALGRGEAVAADGEAATMLEQLGAAGLLADASPATLLSPRERVRFDRQLHYFADAGARPDAVQARLREASVAIVGVGGLGTWTAAALAQTGVGRLVLVDGDRVDDSNLNRQVLFGEADLGAPKVDAAAARLRAMSSLVKVETIARRLDGPGEIRDAVRGCDVVVATADHPPDRIALWVDEACRALGVPHVGAGQFPPRIRVGPFVVPGRTAGICCLHHALRAATPLFDEVQAMRAARPTVAATLAAPSAVVGGLLASEVTHLLGGLGDPATVGRAMVLDLRTMEVEWQPLPEERCPECSPPATRVELTA